MNILFFDPPALVRNKIPERVFGCTYSLHPFPNIFVFQVAAVAKSKDHSVRYRNFPLERAGLEEFISFLKADKSDVYCIYSVNLATRADLETLRVIREVRGSRKVIFFGPAPTYDPDEYLKDENVIVVRGEPEITFSELIDAENDLGNVKGISYLRDNYIRHNPAREINRNLDQLPFPARELADVEKYYNPKFADEKFTAILTSRGCPYRCKFCVPCSLSFAREIEHKKEHLQKPPYVTRSAKSVIEEFIQIKQQGYTAVSILDDEFTIDKKRTIEICRGIKELKITWGCLARADSLDEDIVKEMSRAGCRYIDIGVESFDQRILDDIQKKLDVATIEKAVDLTKKHRILAKINIMFGSSPLESKETVKETLRRLKELKLESVMFSICNPFPGTEYYQCAKEKGWFVKGDYYPIDVQKESTVSLPFVSKKELEHFAWKANLMFFFDPAFIFKNMLKIRSFGDLYHKILVLIRKIS